MAAVLPISILKRDGGHPEAEVCSPLARPRDRETNGCAWGCVIRDEQSTIT